MNYNMKRSMTHCTMISHHCVWAGCQKNRQKLIIGTTENYSRAATAGRIMRPQSDAATLRADIAPSQRRPYCRFSLEPSDSIEACVKSLTQDAYAEVSLG